MDKTRTYASHPAAFIDQPVATPHQPRFAQQLFDFGMIATGNHNFERFAALCNTPGGSQELRNRWSLPFNVPLSCVSFGSPYWRPLLERTGERFTPLGFPMGFEWCVTGRVREPTYRYKIPSVIKNKHSVNYERGQLKSPEKEI